MKYANNPANIRYSFFNKWIGQKDKPSQKRFCEFDNIDFGLRALLYLLLRYYFKSHLTTVEDIISRFAPSAENDTESYINYVSSVVKSHSDYIFADGSFSVRRYLLVIAKAICYFESNSVIHIIHLQSVYTKNISDFAKKLNIQQSRLI